MAVIKNILRTIFTVDGATNTNNSINSVNKNMTRLGQTSASAGRAFSAQASGLGGLVAAYAGAAATTFALQQAFDALARSARATQTLEGLKTLAATSGESSTLLLNNVREITKNQITLAEAASQINLSLSAGFNSSQIEGLGEVALKASRALGRDLNDAYTRVVRGSAKLETELLDELGIYTKIDPATRAYASAIGKTASELTEFERRQAFVNSVIEEGNRKFGSINTTIPTTAETIEAFGTRILDIAGVLGRFLADTLAPLAEFLTNNLTASFSTFGIIAGLVASKGVAVLKGELSSLTANIAASGASAEQSTRNFLGIGKATTNASRDIASYSRELVNATSAEKQLFKALQQNAETRNLSNRELRKANELLDKSRQQVDVNRTALVRERRELQRKIAIQNDLQIQARQALTQAQSNVVALRQQGASSQLLTIATNQLAQAQGRLGGITASTNRQLANLRAQYNANQEAIRGNISELRALNAAQADVARASGLRGGFAGLISGAYIGVAKSVGAVGNAFTGLISKSLGLFSIVSIFSLIGTSIANALGKGEEFDAFIRQLGSSFKTFFVDEDANRIKNTFQGVTAGVLEELENADKELRDLDEFTFNTKFIGVDIKITKTKADLVREVNAELQGVLQGKETKAGVESWGSIIGGAIGAALGASLGTLIPFIGNTLGLAIGGAAGSYIGRLIQDTFTDTEITIEPDKFNQLRLQYAEAFAAVGSDLEKNLAQAFINLEENYGAAALFDPIARRALETQKRLLAESAKYLNNVESISQLTEATGQSANKITEAFNFEKGISDVEEIASSLLTIEDKTYDLKFSFIDSLDADLRNFLENTTFFISTEIEDTNLLESINLVSNRLNELGIDPKTINNVEELSAALQKAGGVEDYRLGIGSLIKELFEEDPAQAKRILATISNGLADVNLNLEDVLGNVQEINIAPAFNEATFAANSFNQSVARGSFNAIEFQRALSAGELDLERFDQGLGAISNSIAQAPEGYLKARDAIFEYLKLAEKIPDIERKNQAIEYGEAQLKQIQNAINAAAANEEIVEVLKSQRKELERQVQLREFLNSLTKDAQKLNSLSTGLELAAVGAPDEIKLAIQLEYLSSLAAATDDQIIKYDNLKASLDSLNISDSARALILNATTDSIDSVNASLKGQGIELKALENGTTELTAAQVEQIDVYGGVSNVVTSTTKNLQLLEKGEATTVDQTKQVTEAMRELVEDVIAKLPGEIKKAVDSFESLAGELERNTKEIVDIKLPKLRIEAELDISKYILELDKILSDRRVSRLEFNIDRAKLQADLGDITEQQAVEIENENRKQIIAEQLSLVEKEKLNADQRLIKQLELLQLEDQLKKDAIKAEEERLKEQIRVTRAGIDSTISAYETIFQTQESVNNTNLSNTVSAYRSIAENLYTNLVNAGLAINKSIRNALKDSPEAGSLGEGVVELATPNFEKANIDFTAAINNLEEAQNKALEGIETNTQAQIDLQNKTYENARNKLINNNILEQEQLANKEGALKRAGQLEDLNARKRLEDLKEEGKAGEDSKKALEESKKKVEEFQKAAQEGFKELIKLANDILKSAFDAAIANKQRQVDQAKITEGITNEVLANTTNRLNSVQSDLNTALNKEASLKDELISLTEKLSEAQANYLGAIQEGNIVQSSEDYVKAILDQSRKTIELNKAIKQRSALETSVKTLEQKKLEAEQLATQATNDRLAAEEDLARLQQTSAAVLSLVSENILNFTNRLQNLGAALAAMSGAFGNTVGGLQQPLQVLNNQFQQISAAVQQVNNAAALLPTTQGLGTTGTGAGTEALGLTAGQKILGNVVIGLGNALSGAGVGSAVGQLIGDDTYASTIGGLVGGALSGVLAKTAFGKAITTSMTTALGGGTVAAGAAASAFTFGVSLLASLVIGKIFGKKKVPTAVVEGVVSELGFEATDVRTKDIGIEAAESINSLIGQIYDGIIGGLGNFGITFQDKAKIIVSNTKGTFGTVITEFESGFKAVSNNIGQTGEDLPEELTKQFFQGVTVDRNAQGFVTFRSLVVDALTPNADNLQQALDVFAELEDVNDKTQKRFSEGVEFARQFSNQLATLNSAAPSLADSIGLIAEAAEANAATIATSYSAFRAQTEQFFGESSPQVEEANQAIKANALAFIGLAENADGAVVSVGEYTSEITASRLSLENTIQRIKSFRGVLASLPDVTSREAAKLISQGLRTTITEDVKEFSDAVGQSLAVLKNPARQAVFDLKATIDDSDALISEAEGLVKGLRKNEEENINAKRNLARATQAVTDSEEIRTIRIKNSIEDLTEAQLKAVIASEKKFDAETRALAQTQLATIEENKRTEALIRFNEAAKDFNQRIADLTGDIANPALASNFTNVSDVAQALGKEDITPFVKTLTDSINGINKFSDVTKTSNKSQQLLNKRLDAGRITQEQYSDAMILVYDATLTAVEGQFELLQAYENTQEQIVQIFQSAQNSLVDSIQGLADEIVSLVEAIEDSTSTIFGIYDDTLTDVARSGNQLFDLRDSAREAFEASAKAVSEFEKANRLSGKSASTIRDEIENIQTSINSLISGGVSDFSSFRELSSLTSRQNALKRELNSVVAVESEYAKLLSDRSRAQDDLAFAESTIITLGNDLIDTRRKESDAVQQIQDTVLSFTQAQQDLKDITEILAENNFDLNRIRSDENNRVLELSNAIAKLNSDSTTLQSTITDILGGGQIRQQLIDSAALFGEQLAKEAELVPESIEWDTLIQEKIDAVTTIFDTQITDLAQNIQSFLSGTSEAADGTTGSLESTDTTLNLLTTKFREFNSDLVKYLDVDGLSLFYGPGGIFKSFRDSLYQTLVVDGFEALTITGGPLDGFYLTLSNVGSALTSLVNVGATLETNIIGAADKGLSLVQAIGTDEQGLTTVFNGLVIAGTDTGKSILSLTSDLGTLTAKVSEYNTLRVDYDPVGDIGNILTSVSAFATELSGIFLTIDSSDLTGGIANVVNVVDSSVAGAVKIVTDSVKAGGDIINEINAFNSTFSEDIAITNKGSTAGGDIINEINAFNSTLSGNTSITVKGSAAAMDMLNQINAYNSTLSGNTSITVKGSTAARDMLNQIIAYNSTLSGNTSITNKGSTAGGDIIAEINAFNSTFSEDIVITNKGSTAGGDIIAEINAFNSTFSGDIVITNKGSTAGGDIINEINAFNSTFSEDIVITNKGSTAGGDIIAEITGFNNQFSADKGIYVTSWPSTWGIRIRNSIAGFNNQFSADKNISVSNKPNLLGSNIATQIGNFNTSISGLSVNTAKNTLLGEAKTAFNGLINVFTDSNKTAIDKFKTSLSDFLTVVQALAKTDIDTKTKGQQTEIGILVDRFNNLKDAVDGIDTTALTTFLTDLNTEISTLNTDIASIPKNITVDANDTQVLKDIATNASKYPKITGVDYDTSAGTIPGAKAYATGGYVQGPGSSTSDSIPARLSDGEYVLRASTVSKLGVGLLNSINKTGDLATSLAKYGRRGDSLVAHLNPDEVRELARMGGSGTRNPDTGMLEFFAAKAPQAVGKVFAKQETNKLYNLYRSLMMVNGPTLTRPKAAYQTVTAGRNYDVTADYISVADAITSNVVNAANQNISKTTNSKTSYDDKKINLTNGYKQGVGLLPPYDMATTETYRDLGLQTAAIQDLANKTLRARKGIGQILNLTSTFGVGDYISNNRITAGKKKSLSFGEQGTNTAYRPLQSLDAIARIRANTAITGSVDKSFTKADLRRYIDTINQKYGNFTDFYMLKDLTKSAASFVSPYTSYAPTSGVSPEGGGVADSGGVSGFTSGGLVRGPRDSIPSMLEPGEFVLRKPAVDKMGLDTAVQLNATGNVDSNPEVNVEVNVINNGNPVAANKQIRQENGKLVVDVILEDIRNNGPIRQSLRGVK